MCRIGSFDLIPKYPSSSNHLTDVKDEICLQPVDSNLDPFPRLQDTLPVARASYAFKQSTIGGRIRGKGSGGSQGFSNVNLLEQFSGNRQVVQHRLLISL